MDCCASIVADEEDSLGLRLVNHGFDLWMNNSRGNRYSRDHQWIDLENCSKETTAKLPLDADLLLKNLQRPTTANANVQ
jgi:hypothetical protein